MRRKPPLCIRPYLNVYHDWKAKGPIRYINHDKARESYSRSKIKLLDKLLSRRYNNGR